MSILPAKTLTQTIFEDESAHPGASGELSQLLNSIALGIKLIAELVATAGFKGLYGYTDRVNVHAERTKLLDEAADNVLVDILTKSRHFGSIVSEERQEIHFIDLKGDVGKYIVAFDPLDGSSHIGSNIPVGTIFAIFRRGDLKAPPSVDDFYQPGSKLVAAGYAIYGAKTSFVYSTGNGVSDFTLDRGIGEFVLSERHLKIPSGGKIFSVNESNSPYWSERFLNLLHSYKYAGHRGEVPYTARYVGTLVADVDRTLRTGGIFFYPPSSKHPKGRLRLLYECIPLAFIIEQANGRAIDGLTDESLLKRIPLSVHEKAGLVCGEATEVEAFCKAVL
jgi:fructose-1,6-bisphosphatase I